MAISAMEGACVASDLAVGVVVVFFHLAAGRFGDMVSSHLYAAHAAALCGAGVSRGSGVALRVPTGVVGGHFAEYDQCCCGC